jgi:uncharacterized protein YqhQ
MMTIFTLINWAYFGIIVYLVAFLTWNLFELDDWKEQVLSVLVLIPFVLRIIGIK